MLTGDCGHNVSNNNRLDIEHYQNPDNEKVSFRNFRLHDPPETVFRSAKFYLNDCALEYQDTA